MTGNKRGEKAALWLRVSTNEQTTDNQLPALLKLAENKGLEVVETYDVTGKSAYHGAHQTYIDKALDDARAGKFSRFIVWSYDRLSRQGVDATWNVIRHFKEAGVTIHSVQEAGLEAMGADAEMMLSLRAHMAKRESEHKGERVKAARERLIAGGKWPGGNIPLGLACIGSDKLPLDAFPPGKAGELGVHEPGAKIVRLIYSLYVDRRLGSHSIAKYLLEERHGRWFPSTITRMLKFDYRGGPHHQHPNVNVPRIIEPAIWERAQALRKLNRRKKPTPRTMSPLQGIVQCAAPCSGNWRITSAVPSRGQKARIYCRHRESPRPGSAEIYETCTVPRQSPTEVAEVLVTALRQELTDHDRYIALTLRSQNDLQAQIEQLERDALDVDKLIGKIEQSNKRLNHIFISGGIEQDEFDRTFAKKSAEIAALRERVPDHAERKAKLGALRALTGGLCEQVALTRIRKEKGVPVGVLAFHPDLAFSEEAEQWAASAENPFNRIGKSADQQLDDLVKRLNITVTMHPEHMTVEGDLPDLTLSVDSPHATQGGWSVQRCHRSRRRSSQFLKHGHSRRVFIDLGTLD